jgi:c-di-GMP-binding flagellar brake protein YcgR
MTFEMHIFKENNAFMFNGMQLRIKFLGESEIGYNVL